MSCAAVTLRARFTFCSASRRSQSRLSEASCGEWSASSSPLRRDTCCGDEPCERRVARDRRETASAGPSPAQVTDLRLLQSAPGAAVSRAVERFAKQRVSCRTSRRAPRLELSKLTHYDDVASSRRRLWAAPGLLLARLDVSDAGATRVPRLDTIREHDDTARRENFSIEEFECRQGAR